MRRSAARINSTSCKLKGSGAGACVFKFSTPSAGSLKPGKILLIRRNSPRSGMRMLFCDLRDSGFCTRPSLSVKPLASAAKRFWTNSWLMWRGLRWPQAPSQ